MVRVSGKIRRILLDSGMVNSDAWSSAVESGRPVLQVLMEGDSGLTEGEFLSAVGQVAGVAPVELSACTPEVRALEALDKQACLKMGVLPLVRNGDLLTIAVADPFDVLLFDDLSMLSGCKIRPVLSHPAGINAAIESCFDDGSAAVDELLGEVNADDIEVRTEEDETEEMDLAALAAGDDVPAVKLANLILLRGLKERASDIHIEPGDHSLRVRYRIDGRLVEAMRPPKALAPALISRLKILADLDIAERMGPQDGKFQIRYEGRAIDLRLSTLPVVGGEKAVMRILDAAGVAMDLEDMGFEDRALSDILEASQAAHGMLLVTGPTGSGKSTTLYSCVKTVSTPEINVVTVEDPVEYRMDGVNQVPVNPKRGLTFAGALRSILRQDPDVVLVGEIRDAETAEIAVKAALTGHMVLSTLHTNDAPGTITRLVDMGIDPFLVSSSVNCVAAQRLVRRLCPHCKQADELPKEELFSIGYSQEEVDTGFEIWRPRPDGCSRCSKGYRGRLALLETMSLDKELRRMIVDGAGAAELKSKALEKGMVTLRRTGLMNAIRGHTSLEEVLRVTTPDR
ncbi:MAG: ATPase, T2SS/T4P/T4SS family [Planctomycetota bacterium]|nr:ATPase, T2SS/T4P/T4SS family [Planctomycetota bacterium]